MNESGHARPLPDAAAPSTSVAPAVPCSRSWTGIFRDSFIGWWEANPFLVGAALAYYTIFSLAPVVMIAVSIASLFFEEAAARAQLLQEIRNAVGSRVGDAIEAIIQNTQETKSGRFATLVSLGLLLFGASTVFAQLQEALNGIWGVRARPGRRVWRVVKDRLFSFLVVLSIGFLLLASLMVSAVLAGIAHFLSPYDLPGGVFSWQAVDSLVSLLLSVVLFAIIFKLLPDVEIEWGDVWVGSAVTAVLFAVGKHLIGLYLGRSGWISAYGAAGSIVVVLVWVYYSSQILLLGAQFTHVYACQSGKPVVPKRHAERDDARSPSPG